MSPFVGAATLLAASLVVGVSSSAARRESVPLSNDGTAALSYKDDILVMNADGSSRKNLTRSAADDLDPAWSRDGAWIAFDSSSHRNVDVYLMAADGSGQRNVTNGRGVLENAGP